MYVGYYLDPQHTQAEFLETTMLGQVQGDRYSDTQRFNASSWESFTRAVAYATDQYAQHRPDIVQGSPGYAIVSIADCACLRHHAGKPLTHGFPRDCPLARGHLARCAGGLQQMCRAQLGVKGDE